MRIINTRILLQYKKLAYLDGKTLNFSKEAIDIIANTALLNETGARGLRNIIETVLNDFMFDYPDTNDNIIEITEDYCNQKLEKLIKQIEIKKAA